MCFHFKHCWTWKCNVQPGKLNERADKLCYDWGICKHSYSDEKFMQQWNTQYWIPQELPVELPAAAGSDAPAENAFPILRRAGGSY